MGTPQDMGTWAGADRMQVHVVHAKSGRGARLRLLRESIDRPAPHSVHLVDEDFNETLCGAVEPAVLTRLDKPWEEWSQPYRCSDCHALSD